MLHIVKLIRHRHPQHADKIISTLILLSLLLLLVGGAFAFMA